MSPQFDWNTLGRYGRVMAPWQWAIAVVVLCVFVWLMFQLREWFREDSARDGDNFDMLTQFRDLRQQGDLSEDEYKRIKSRLIRDKGVATGNSTPSKSPAKDAITPAPTNRIDGSGQGGPGKSSSPENSPTLSQVVLPKTEETTAKESEEED